MILQNILWPSVNICMEEKMYFRKNEYAQRLGEMFSLEKGGYISSDTYFNGVSVDKWHKYTKVQNIQVTLRLRGDFKISLIYKKKIHQQIFTNIVSEKIFRELNGEEVTMNFPEGSGMAYFKMEALKDGCEFFGGYYSTDIAASDLRIAKIAIGICTFRRESFVENNLRLLNHYILKNSDSELYSHLEVFIADNGQTLDIDKLSASYVHIVKNKNVGGAGGFTRDLIEMLNVNKNGANITHVLLMDDDITIDPESLLKTYRILCTLKEEYKDAFIGGAMLRNDAQNIQVESGASWNAGGLISLKSNLDMTTCSACLYNEMEEYREFNAWWYCCFPMNVVTEENLPLPIFIRGDDVEYGLRNMKNLILMNGICVWHEPFENKYSSFLSYYILRNQFIDNALHFPQYGKREAKKQVRNNIIREILYFRYKNVDLIVRGVRDFLGGIDWLLQSDGEALHKEIMASGYKAQPLANLPMTFSYSCYEESLKENDFGWKRMLRLVSINGYLLPPRRDNVVSMAYIRPYNAYRTRRILNYDVSSQKGFITERNLPEMVRCARELVKIIYEINSQYDKAAESYRQRYKEIQNIHFWKKYLSLQE